MNAPLTHGDSHPADLPAPPAAPPGARLDLLRRGNSGDLYRVHGPGDGQTRLARVLGTHLTDPATLSALSHELALRHLLDSHWAVQPLELVRWEGRPVLLLADCGAVPLDGLSGRAMETGAFLAIAVALSVAVGRLHAQGLIHKDIQPGNVMVDRASGAVWLTGFGIASRQPRERQPLAPVEDIAGTLAYMAPEQTGRMNRSIDSRSDLYALGVTFYEMLTGSLPFDATDPMALFHCHLARLPTPPARAVHGVPQPLSDMVMKLLAKAADDRYQTASGLESDLRRCLAQWQSHARIEAFALGTRDMPAQLLIPERLYGREAEIALLTAAFDRVAAHGAPELVLVSGYPGIGKSSVVNELHKVLFPRNGLFASAKFDQYKRDIPHVTLAQAFRPLVRQILGQSEAEVSAWRQALEGALGPNAGLVIKLIPDLAFVLGPQPAVPELASQDALNRFQTVFSRFIGVFAQPEHPLVLFLDDLQWLDAASLKLIEHAIVEQRVPHLLLIGAFRDNALDALQPLARMLDAIRRAQVMTVQQIVLTPLALAGVQQFIADTLRDSAAHTEGLAELVHEKTGGNPFFAVQFITALSDEGLLAFDPARAAWTWDLDAIRSKRFTDNVVELMIARLRRLPAAALEALKWLGCLGASATAAQLGHIGGSPEDAIHEALSLAVRAGLVFRAGDTYTFLHDRIQEAAYALTPPASRPRQHLNAGRLLAAHTAAEDIEDKVFDIVNQFNRGAALIDSPAERERLAELDLIAGRRAREASAFAAALAYFSIGCTLLRPTAWDERHALAFALHFHRAECEYLTGNLAVAQEVLADLVGREAGLDERSAVTCLRVNLFTTLDRCDLAVEAGLDYLRRVGVEWLQHPTSEDVRLEFDRLRQRLGDRDIEQLVDLPLMDDPAQRATMDVLTTILPPTLFTDQNLLGLVVGRMANISLEHGHSDGSCIGYAWIGMFMGPRFGDYAAGFRFGQLGLDLVEKRGLDRFKARVYVHFGNVVIPWTQPFRSGCEWVRRAFETANRNGDLTFEVYSCNHLITNMLASGEPLAEIEREAENGLAFARKARFGLVIDIITAQLQLITALRGHTRRADPLETVETVEPDDEQFERHLQEDSRLAIAACWYWIRKLQSRWFAGDGAGALEAAAQAEPLLWTSPSHVEVADYHFWAALARAAACAHAAEPGRAALLAALTAHHRQLQEWASNCPENFADRAALVGAEIARIEGRELDAMRLYEQAIRAAREQGFVHTEAMACELAAAFYRQRGFADFADTCFALARDGYARWGADGKVRQLDAARPLPRLPHAPGPATSLAQLDLLAVAKASQAISGRIVMDELVETLLRIVLENAGAQVGYLLLTRDEGLTLAAEASAVQQGGVRVRLHLGKGLVPPPLPWSLINVVTRSRAPVLLADAAQLNPFSNDPCWAHRQPKSVLCLPIVRQSSLLGVLYLENNLLTRAFLPQRVTVLELLAAQAAISLENALLVADLQRENEMRQQAETTLREQDSRIRRLVDANIIGVFFWDVDGGISDANDAFLSLVGYVREEMLSGAVRWLEMTPPEHREADARAIKELFEVGRCTPYEKEFFHKSGQRIPVLAGAAFLEGSRLRGVAFVLDLSERRLADSEREARRVADAANRAKSVFLATMSHELRTPLNAILGYAQILKHDKTLDDRKLAQLGTIHRSGEHLLMLINDILDLSRIEAGKLEIQPEPVVLSDFLLEINEIIDIKAREKGLEFVVEGLDARLPVVEADERRLRQVLLNLLSNAVKFTPRGKVTLRMQQLDTSAPGADDVDARLRLRFEVQDEGVGIAPDELAGIFEPFQQATDVQLRFGGTGLGLSISRQLVRLMGGDIGIESQLGAGSRFWFELDLRTAPLEPWREARHTAHQIVGYEGRRRTLLIVDDIEANRRLLVDLLSSIGFDTPEAEDGSRALTRAEALRPDLIVMDSVMPQMDGLEATRQLRGQPSVARIPIIVVSASASATDRQASLDAGADGFLPKPVHLNLLLREIGALLGLRWITDDSTSPVAHPAPAAHGLVVPPTEEAQILYRLAQIGNMRSIIDHADHIETLGVAYGPLARQLRALAQTYQSRALIDLAATFLERQAQP
jgi:PAS domain S-box-containing protein